MNNFVVVAGTVNRINKNNVNGRDLVNLSVKVDSLFNGKTVSAFLPVQVSMSSMVEKCDKIQVGSRVLVEGRFETYTSNNKTGYNITQLTTLQTIDEGDVNHIVVWGRITSDVRYNTTTGGNKVAGVSIANSRSYPVKAPDGSISEWKEITSFIPVNAWGDLADVLNTYEKGKTIWVTGRLASRSYDNKEGQKVYITEVIADSITAGGTGKHNVVEEVDGTTSGTSGTTTNTNTASTNKNTTPTQMQTSMPSSSTPDTGFVPLDDFTDEDELPF